MIALARESVDVGVLRERAKSLLDCACETRVGSNYSGRVRSSGANLTVEYGGALSNGAEGSEIARVHLIVVEQLRLQVRAYHRVKGAFQDHAGAQLPLDRQVDVVGLGQARGLLTLEPRHARSVRD